MSGERIGHRNRSIAPYPSIWEDFMELLLYVYNVHRVDITLLDEYSIVHLLIKFRDCCV